MKVGIIGAGAIAGTMAGTIKEMDCAQNYAVAGRLNLQKHTALRKPMAPMRSWWRILR